MLVAAADEHDEVAHGPDPFDVEHAVSLAIRNEHRPEVPNLAVPHLRDLPWPDISGWKPLNISQPRSSYSAATTSLRTAVDLSQSVL